MTYGSNPFWLKPQEQYLRIRPIQPGETQEIRLSNEAYKEMRRFLKKVGYSAGGEKVRVAISTVGFTDGTAWRDRLYYRDPGASDGWTTEEKPQGSARNRTAFFHELVQTSNGSFRPVQKCRIERVRESLTQVEYGDISPLPDRQHSNKLTHTQEASS